MKLVKNNSTSNFFGQENGKATLAQGGNPPTNYYATTKNTIRDFINTRSPNEINKNLFNASFFEISKNFFEETRVRGVIPNHNQNLNVTFSKQNAHAKDSLYKKKRNNSQENLCTKLHKASHESEVKLPKIRLKKSNGCYVKFPLHNDYCFKKSKNFTRESVLLKEKVNNILNDMHHHEESHLQLVEKLHAENRYRTSILLDSDNLLNTTNKEYFNLLCQDKEKQKLDLFNYGIFDNKKKTTYRSNSYLDSEMKYLIEEKLEELENPDDSFHKENKGRRDPKKITTLTENKSRDAKIFKEISLKSGEKYLNVNNRITYPATMHDSLAINYLFKNNIDKMNWEQEQK